MIKQIKKYKKRTENNIMIVEGLNVLEMLCKSEHLIKYFLYCYDEVFSDEALKIKEYCENKADEVFTVSKKVFENIKEKENSIGMIAVVEYKELNVEDIDINRHKLILINDGIELPGNLGTIYRTAYSTNVDLIINIDCKTDIYKPKFLSSSRGYVFNLPTINSTYEKIQDFLLQNNYRIILLEPELGSMYRSYDYNGNIAIVVGSERFGINKNWYSNKHEEVFIPMREDINSLNVGVATSIVLYEAFISRGIK